MKQTRYPCIFRGPEIRATDDRIQSAWKARHGHGAPFGSLRQTWRRSHCRTINPYGSDSCPFTIEQCRSAFESAVLDSLGPHVIDGRVYFISVAKSTGMERAENKPKEAFRISPTIAQGPGVIGVVGVSDRARRAADLGITGIDYALRDVAFGGRRHLRRGASEPTRIGEMLRPADGRARQRPDDHRRTDRKAEDDPRPE